MSSRHSPGKLFKTCLFPDEVIMQKYEFRTLFNKGSLVLGQEQDGILTGGYFNKQQAFSGKLAQVEMWNIELASSDIYLIANCSMESTAEANRVVTWGSDLWDPNNVDMVEVELSHLCKTDPLLDKFIWPAVISYTHYRSNFFNSSIIRILNKTVIFCTLCLGQCVTNWMASSL
jgi:hypothetical protein